MHTEFLNHDTKLVISSDRWHVIHAEWSASGWSDGDGTPKFVRAIVSEHATCDLAVTAARILKSRLMTTMKSRPRDAWDQVIVKRPESETLKSAGRLIKRRKSAG